MEKITQEQVLRDNPMVSAEAVESALRLVETVKTLGVRENVFGLSSRAAAPGTEIIEPTTAKIEARS